MPEENPNQNTPRRRISFGIIVPFLLMIALVVTMLVFYLRNPATDTLTKATFTSNLTKGNVTTAVITPKDSTIVNVTGKYKTKTTTGKDVIHNYKVNISFVSFYEETESYTGVYIIGDTDPHDVSDVTISQLIDLCIDGEHVVTNDAYVTSFWDQWGPTIISAGVSLLLILFLFTRLGGAIGQSNMKALEFNKSRARKVNNSKVKFSDVAGCDAEKAEMVELVDYLKDPKKFSRYGAKLPKGIILVGPPGTGKTLLAKAVAGEAGVPFYSISGSDFVEMFVGVGAGRVRDMFKVAKENAPCLVFIDEIDAVGRQRGAGLGGGNDEREQTLNQLLVELDGFEDNSGIIVIAATNRDDVLDPALLRAGRFDRKITVSLPDREGREAIFHVHARGKKISKDVDFGALSRRTVGFSGADIENILNEAAILAVRKNKEEVDVDDIDEAIDRRIAGPAKTSHALNKHERELVAFHEAGHAIIGLKLPHSDKVQKITIIPRGNTGGHVRMTPEEDRFLLTESELKARICGYLGGRTSEEIFFKDITTGASNDIEMATQIARMMVTELGMSSLGPIQYEKNTGSVFLGRDYTSNALSFSHETALQIDNEIRRIIDEAHKQATEIITKHKAEVTLIANTLLEHEQITAEEIDYLLEHGHLKRDEESEKPSEEAKENEGE